MGQQQLLLVILVTILVGIATVIAMNVFGTSAENANRDAVRQDLLLGATNAQAVWTKPAMLDGAGQDFTRAALTNAVLIRRLGMPVQFADGTTASGTNENGAYEITAKDVNSVTIQGTPSQSEGVILAVACRDDNSNWQVAVADATAPDPCGTEEVPAG